MRVIKVEKKPLFFEEEKLSPEEKKYRSAVKLMESVDCVVRFETAVESLNSAAALFDGLEDYKESRQKAKECKSLAEQRQETGIQEAYLEAVNLQDNAKTKIDYRTIISEFERFPDYKDSQKRIEECKKTLRRIASRQAWRNRGIAILVLAAIAAIFWISPAKPYTKGLIRMEQGHYRIAIQHFKKAGHFLNADNMRKKCYYKQALEAYESADSEQAMVLCRKAEGRADADLLLTRIEIENISDTGVGDTIVFGKGIWQVLEADGQKRLLLCSGIVHNRTFSSDTNEWDSSLIRRWMNSACKKKLLNQGERKLLQTFSNGSEEKKQDKIYLLSSEEYKKYEKIITPAYIFPDLSKTELQSEYMEGRTSTSGKKQLTDIGEWWLKDAGGQDGTACYVDITGTLQTTGKVTEEKGVRPLIEISLDENLLEDTPSTPTPASKSNTSRE